MDTIKREGVERLHYIVKHYRKLAKIIQKLYPEGDSLCRAYQSLDKAFEEVISEESKYQANFTSVKINGNDYTQSITKGISEELNEITKGASIQ